MAAINALYTVMGISLAGGIGVEKDGESCLGSGFHISALLTVSGMLLVGRDPRQIIIRITRLQSRD